MGCPGTHEWYELERGSAPREDAERLRRHVAECADCRARADDVRDIAASLEHLAGASRTDLSPEAARGLIRRARVHGLLGRRPRMSLLARAGRTRWMRWALPLAAAVAAAMIIAVGVQRSVSREVLPDGALERLVRAANGVRAAADLRRLAPMTRAAVSEELARPDASADQVADLLLVAYIAERPREDRQAADVSFLLGEIWARRPRGLTFGPAWPTLISSAMADTTPLPEPAAAGAGDSRNLRGDRGASALAEARGHLLAGRYAEALAAAPDDDSGAVLRAWCLERLGRRTEAAQTFAVPDGRGDAPLARVLRADLALGAQDVAEAMRQYETLAAERDRYWFPAGYLCRYELGDLRGAGLRFERIRDGRLAGYVAGTFKAELAACKVPEPAPLLSEDFESLELGRPQDWALIRARGGEFEVVDVPGGKALRQDEIEFRGAELLCGEPEWADYTLQVDVKVVEHQGDYAVGAVAYRRADHTGYVLELSSGRLRILKQFSAERGAKKPADAPSECLGIEPKQAQMHLDQPPAKGWWYTLKMRVQRVDNGVSVAGKFWRTDAEEPLGWQVVWTDTGQAGVGPLAGGAAGVQISGARVLIDNVVVSQDKVSKDVFAAAP